MISILLKAKAPYYIVIEDGFCKVVSGDPDTVREEINPTTIDFLLLEDGSFLLLESGDKIIME